MVKKLIHYEKVLEVLFSSHQLYLLKHIPGRVITDDMKNKEFFHKIQGSVYDNEGEQEIAKAFSESYNYCESNFSSRKNKAILNFFK